MILSGCNSSSHPGSEAALSAAQSPESSGTSDNPLVRQTLYGAVQGIEADYATWAWLGVPYAKPPVGSLRWRAPRDPEQWNGVRDASTFCSYCPQYGNYLSETGRDTMGGYIRQGVPTGDEDCLYLNIWRPATSEQKLPVYVFIHGGANIIGRSDLSIYNGAHFAARENMLFVTINYRLGFFGWFWHPALKVDDDPLENSGNFGTLDIIKALTWIRDNIAAFGGDPGNVTITGQSAGAMNVYSMMVSPLAKGLFHRAVAHSGASQACFMSRAVQKAKATVRRLLKQDGYTSGEIDTLTKDGNEAWIRNYLRSKTMEEFYDPKNCGPMAMPIDGIPTVETIMGVYIDGTVIPTSPLLSFYNGTYNKVPLMMSCTKEELKLFLPMIIMEPLNLWQVVYDFDPNAPHIDLGDYLSTWSYPLMPLYTVGPPAGQAVFQGFGTDTMAPLAKKYQDKVYVYKFMWDDEPAPFDYLIGAGHAMDLPFVFGNFISDKSSLCNFAWSEANKAGREKISAAMMDYLGQFARTGDPNGGNAALPVWLPWSSAKNAPKRMIFDSDGIVMSNEYLEPEELCVSCEAYDMLSVLLTLMGFSADA